MPDRKFHEKRAREVFGEPWTQVHAWLDALAFGPDGRLDINHHRHRHHIGGVHEVERLWGETAAAVARQHIKDDDGKVFTEDEIKRIYPDGPEWKTMEPVRKRVDKNDLRTKGGL